MAIDRNDHLVDNWDMAIHCPGAYMHVLTKVCQEHTYRDGDAILRCSSPEQLEQMQRDYGERTAALIQEKMGEPVLAHSAHLPSGLPAPFERFPRGELRGFSVMPDDRIHLLPRRGRDPLGDVGHYWPSDD